MKTSRLVVLAVLVVALGAWILLVERHMPTTDQAKQRADKVFPDFDRDAVTGLEIHNAHGDFTLEKRDGDWYLTAPIETRADDTSVGSLLTALGNLKVNRSLGRDEVDPTAYGLDEPEIRVTLTGKDGGHWELAVGSKTALGSDRAVSRGDGNVLITTGWFVTDLDRGLDDWRSRDVVDLFADQVADLKILKKGKDRIEVVRDGGLWKLLEPLEDLADRTHVEDLIADLNALRVKTFLDGDTDPAELGLDRPRYVVTIVRTEGKAPVRLEFGRVEERDGSKQVACRRDGKDLFWVGDNAELRLGRAPVLWRSHVLYPFSSWDVEKVAFSSGDTTVELERKDGVWKTADGGDADGAEVLRRLNALASMKALDFDLVRTGTPEIGRITLTLSADGGQDKPRKVTFTFQEPFTAGGRALAVVDARDTVMSVDRDGAAKLFENLDALRGVEPTPSPSPPPGDGNDG